MLFWDAISTLLAPITRYTDPKDTTQEATEAIHGSLQNIRCKNHGVVSEDSRRTNVTGRTVRIGTTSPFIF